MSLAADQPPRVVLLGAGGHAKVLVEAFLAARAAVLSDAAVVGLLDDDPSRHGADVHGLPVFGGCDLLSRGESLGFNACCIAVGSAGPTAARVALAARAADSGVGLVGVQHPTATLSPSASVRSGCHIMAGAVIQADARLGRNVIVNSRAVVEHDAAIGDHSHVAPGAVVCGRARVGQGVHVGAGAVVLQNVTIGQDAVIGAGAVVTKDIEPGVTVIGVPAAPLPPRSAEDDAGDDEHEHPPLGVAHPAA